MKTIYFLLGCFITFNVNAQQWSAAQLVKANTAKEVKELTFEEKQTIMYLNLARMYPKDYKRIEFHKKSAFWSNYRPWNGFVGKIDSTYVKSLLKTLETMKPVNPVYYNSEMYELAKCFSNEKYESNKMGHDRKKCKYGFSAECISYGKKTGLEIINQLLVDHGIQDLGHREICLANGYESIGVKINKHKTYEFFAILDFN
jgi:uncharacterized protein YkwD